MFQGQPELVKWGMQRTKMLFQRFHVVESNCNKMANMCGSLIPMFVAIRHIPRANPEAQLSQPKIHA